MLSSLSIHFTPVLPVWFVALLALGLLALLAYGCTLLQEKQVPGKWIGVLAGLRVVIVAVFMLCLLQPVLSYWREARSLPRLALLVDASKSMSARAGSG